MEKILLHDYLHDSFLNILVSKQSIKKLKRVLSISKDVSFEISADG